MKGNSSAGVFGESISGLLRPMAALFTLLVALFATNVKAQAITVNWLNWTAPATYPLSNSGPPYNYANGASGTITLPDGSVVNATLTGEVLDQSCFTVSSTNCPSGYWRSVGGWGPSGTFPAGTFTSSNVPSVPPTANVIVQAGYQSATHTLTFSRPVTNLVMNVFSLGGGGSVSAYVFDRDITVLSQNPACGYSVTSATTYTNCLTVNGRTLTGKEGSGTVQFPGTFSTLSWTVSIPEYYSGFNVGITSASAPGAPTVTAISPSSGTTAGGTSVTITGTNFTGATSVTIGGVAALSFTVNSATLITATTPAGAAGTASVQVTTSSGGNSANSLYTYVAPPPGSSGSPSPIPTLSEWALILFGSLMAGAMVWYQRRRV